MKTNLLLFLIGYRGTGKSTVAQRVAGLLGWDFCDADTELEARCGRSIRQIFAEEGEAGFRQREAALLGELCRRQQCVIATGGGIVLRAENRRLLCESGTVVWLRADAETLWQRLEQDTTTAERRPVLTVGGLAEVREMLAVREPLYRECAHWSVDTANQTPEELAQMILQWFVRLSSGQRGA